MLDACELYEEIPQESGLYLAYGLDNRLLGFALISGDEPSEREYIRTLVLQESKVKVSLRNDGCGVVFHNTTQGDLQFFFTNDGRSMVGKKFVMIPLVNNAKLSPRVVFLTEMVPRAELRFVLQTQED